MWLDLIGPLFSTSVAIFKLYTHESINFQPLVMHLACVTFGMTMNEALVASTINAAASIGRSQTHGSLEVGKVADMLILDCPRYHATTL